MQGKDPCAAGEIRLDCWLQMLLNLLVLLLLVPCWCWPAMGERGSAMVLVVLPLGCRGEDPAWGSLGCAAHEGGEEGAAPMKREEKGVRLQLGEMEDDG